MQRVAFFLLCFVSIVALRAAPATSDEAAAREHVTSRAVAPGVISTSAVEVGISFDAAGNAWFTRYEGSWGRDLGPGRIMVSRPVRGGFADPQPAPFARCHSDSDAFIAPDGRIFFVSDRADGSGDIFVVEPGDRRALEPTRVAGAVNSDSREWSPVVTHSGRLYFASDRPGGYGQGDLYVAEPQDAGYSEPRNLGPAINSATGEWNLVVDPEERFMIFEASGREQNRSAAGDLWIAIRDPDSGAWQTPSPLVELNTEGSDLQPALSRDGKTLYFTSTSTRNAPDADIRAVEFEPLLTRYSTPAELIAELFAVSRAGHALHRLWPRSADSRPVATGRGPHELAIAAGRRRAFVADYGIYPEPRPESPDQIRFRTEPGGTVSVVDLDAWQRIATWTLAGCARPHGIEVSHDETLLWVTCEDSRSVVALDIEDGREQRRIAAGHEGPHMVRASEDGRWLAVTCVEAGGVLIVDLSVDRSSWIPTGAGAEGLEFAPGSKRLWVLNGGDDSISVVDLARSRVVGRFPSRGRFPIRIQFDRERGQAWVANNQSRSLIVFDAMTFVPLGEVVVDAVVLGLLIPPHARHAYVSQPRESRVLVIDLESRRPVRTLEAGPEVDGLAAIP
jgi:DNA-binding beta-propeller fold protein YncE